MMGTKERHFTSLIHVNVLVTPAEVMENQPMLDLIWRTRFRRTS